MKKPCMTCPWRRGSPGLVEMGNGDPARFIGQAHGAFWLPCHSSKGYDDDTREPGHKQCVGAAMFRDLVGVAEKLPEQLAKHKGDPSIVFDTPAEFLAHHAQVQEYVAEAWLANNPPDRLLVREMMRSGTSKQEVG